MSGYILVMGYKILKGREIASELVHNIMHQHLNMKKLHNMSAVIAHS